MLTSPLIRFRLRINAFFPQARLLTLRRFRMIDRTISSRRMQRLNTRLMIRFYDLTFYTSTRIFQLLRQTYKRRHHIIKTFTRNRKGRTFLNRFMFAAVTSRSFHEGLNFSFTRTFRVIRQRIFGHTATLQTSSIQTPTRLNRAINRLNTRHMNDITPRMIFITINSNFFMSRQFSQIFFQVMQITRRRAQRNRTGMAKIFQLTRTLPFNRLQTFRIVFRVLRIQRANRTFRTRRLQANHHSRQHIKRTNCTKRMLRRFRIQQT